MAMMKFSQVMDPTTWAPTSDSESISMPATAIDPPGHCPWCSNPSMGAYSSHSGACPNVKAIEYFPDGSTKRVEFRD